MGLLSRLFGSRAETLTKENSIQDNKLVTSTTDNKLKALSVAQNELLMRIPKQQIDSHMADVWTPEVGSLEQNITRFINDGLIQEATVVEKIDVKYRIVDLKPILERYGVKTKGKKMDMIKSLLGIISPEEAQNLVKDTKLYMATTVGQQHIDAYREQKRQAISSMETDALAYIQKGDILNAVKRIATYNSKQIFSRGQTETLSIGISDPINIEVKYLLNHTYGDLDLNEDKRKEIGSRLILSVLLGESVHDTGNRLLEVTNGTFPCAQLIEFLQNNPCGGYASHFDPNKPEHLAELYAHTRIFEANSVREIHHLKACKCGKGIEILPVGNDDCKLCKQRKLKYSWSEVDSLPKLPRHWGCRCDYVAWID